MKKFMNDPANFVREMIEGVYLANKDKLKWVPEYNILYRADLPKDKVAIMQGSGSGHEPAHIMCVGKGFLDAACPGNVFAAPPMNYVLECTKLIKSDKGVLHLINNYQGDRMAWATAKEEAEELGIKIGVVIIDDDVSVKDSTYTTGRRGVAGNFFIIKAVGAAAEKGADLDQLVELGKKVNSRTRSMGVALSSCIPPAKGSPIFKLGPDEIEVGVGIHGEPGRRRDKIKSAKDIIEEVFTAIHDDIPFKKGDRVAVMVNGLGGTPISELYLLYREAAKKCEETGLTIAKNYVGNYCTSLEMAGFSLTLVQLDDEIEGLLNDPAEIPIRVF
ncbi:MAG: dihydroxyacetone kinase subunit DhaK [Spirochaetaceae bacterium]|jgi:dihydroxyacetone kinase-like protein|nr:dihydroxyacetone kinase subunit DhaK [Spirochaetaceae bacterium]